MPVNNLEFNQLATILNSIHSQATGTTGLVPTNTSEFVSVATTTLKTGYDPVINAVSQVIGRNIFSIRPYERKFRGLEVDNQRFGYITRKFASIDKSFEDNDEYKKTDGEVLKDGTSVDPWVINKPEVLQTNFYGVNTYQKSLTTFKNQLDSAFSGVDQFNEFVTMTTQNVLDMIEQAHENTARSTIANFIGGVFAANKTNQQIKLLSEYNSLTGLELDNQTVYKPENFAPFMRWVYSRVADISSKLTERTSLYHFNLEGKPIMRHTPRNRQKMYLYAPAQHQLEAQVLADTFNASFLKMVDNELVNFWQSIETPDSINVTPVWMKNDGTLSTESTQIAQDNIFGVIFDEDAMGYTVMNQWTQSTGLNARGGYFSSFYHFTDRYWNDFSENFVILLLE